MRPPKIKNTTLALAIFCQATASYAEQPAQFAYAAGGVAQADAIFSASRGRILDEEVPANSPSQTDETHTVQQPSSVVATTTPTSLVASPPLATEMPTVTTLATSPHTAEAANLPLARGDLAEAPTPALTDNLARNLALSLGGLALSTSLDHSGDQFARDHGQNATVKAFTNVGNALPFIAIGFAGLAALDTSDPRMSRTGFSALQAGGFSALSSFGLKYVFARARPEAELGSTAFHNSATSKGDSSFPSIHTATTWGIITPFAKEYDMPWLYGVAALTNFARVADRKHWVSDTIAGSLIGYWAGEIAWQRNKPKPETATQVYIGERSVTVAWPF